MTDPKSRWLHPIPAPLEPAPVTLTGRRVRLVPLATEHIPHLCRFGLDPDLWTFIPISVTTPEAMEAYVQSALRDRDLGSALPFATTLVETGEFIGCTRYGNIDRVHRRVEIGWTFVAKPWQRSFANTEAKYLMLRHAFETLGCLRVELKTDRLNERSRNAIARLGATQEGIFRQHVICHDGRVRDSVYFSILDTEWPLVQANLLARMEPQDLSRIS